MQDILFEFEAHAYFPGRGNTEVVASPPIGYRTVVSPVMLIYILR